MTIKVAIIMMITGHGLELQLVEEQVFERPRRAKSVKDRAEGERREDQPHEHARNGERLARRLADQSPGQPTLDDGGQCRAVAPTAELSTRLVKPKTKSPVMKKKMRKGMMPARASAAFPEAAC